LAGVQAGLEKLAEAGVSAVALSTDPLERAEEMVSRCALAFPVGYGLPLVPTAATLGAFYEERRGILHATGFLLRRDGTIAVASYSSGAIGRLVADDVLRLVQYWDR
jgi:peroxiredoxin